MCSVAGTVTRREKRIRTAYDSRSYHRRSFGPDVVQTRSWPPSIRRMRIRRKLPSTRPLCSRCGRWRPTDSGPWRRFTVACCFPNEVNNSDSWTAPTRDENAGAAVWPTGLSLTVDARYRNNHPSPVSKARRIQKRTRVFKQDAALWPAGLDYVKAACCGLLIFREGSRTWYRKSLLLSVFRSDV